MLSLDPSPSLAAFSSRRHGISAGSPASPLRRGKRLSISPRRPFDERARVTELFLEKKLPKMDATSKIFDPSPSIILTCGRSRNISMLLSLRLLKSFIMLLNAFLLRFLFPSRPQKQSFPVEKPKEEKQETGGCKTRRRVQADIFSQRNISPGFNSDQGTMTRRALAIRRVAQDGDGSSVRDFSFFVTPRGDTLFTQSWTPVSIKVRGLVVLLHGLNEHSSRYDNFSKQLNANGYKVYGMDWIGHGGSDGLHAYVHSLDDAVGDMKAFLEKVLGENPELPCFFFGHSTGAAIVLKAVLDPKVESVVEGMVLTSPAIRVQPSHPIIGLLAPLFSLLLPKYQFSAANKPGLPVSRDPEALTAKYSDPLVYTGSIRVRTGSEILRITSYLQQNLTKVTVPFLVLHGTLDTVTDPEASQKLYEEASSTDKSIKLYEGLLHDLLFEPEREAIAQDIIDWLNSKLK